MLTLPLEVDSYAGEDSLDCWNLAYNLGGKCPSLNLIISFVPGKPEPGGWWRIIRTRDGSVREVRGVRANNPEEVHVIWM